MMKKLILVLLTMLLLGPVWAEPINDADAARARAGGDHETEMKALSPVAPGSEAWVLEKLRFTLPLDFYGVRGAAAPMVTWAEAAHGRGDYAAELKITRPLALAGDAWGQASLGTSYLLGTGVTKNTTEALKWYRLAAEKGFAGAQYNLGFLYQTGEGVMQDDAEAVKWYRLAAGLAAARCNLGVMYASGRGVAQDYAKAYALFSIYGTANAHKNRDLAARSMTPQQIADAQNLVRECQARNYKDCY